MSSGQMDPDHFILCLAAALKSPDIVGQLKQITQTNHDEFADLISAELYRQLQPYKEELRSKDQEIKMLKKTIAEQNDSISSTSMGGAIALECQVFLKPRNMTTQMQPSYLFAQPSKLIRQSSQ